MKPSTPARPKELTPQEKADQIARILSQKRESFALSAFAGLMQNPALPQIALIREGLRQGGEYRSIDLRPVAEAAVQAADALMEKLYPIVKEGKEYGVKVKEFVFIVEIEELGGKARLEKIAPVRSITVI